MHEMRQNCEKLYSVQGQLRTVGIFYGLLPTSHTGLKSAQQTGMIVQEGEDEFVLVLVP